jgi:hypothetical protein
MLGHECRHAWLVPDSMRFPGERGVERTPAMRIRFPPPWSAEATDACFIVRDHNGQALAYVHFEDESGRRSAAHLLTRDEARRIAANISKLPQGAAAEATGLYRSHFRYDLTTDISPDCAH